MPRKTLLRVLALIALVVAFGVWGRTSGLAATLTVANVRALAAEAGAWGVVVFVGVFCLGELLYVPCIAFVVAAVVAYGRVTGLLVAWPTALVALTLAFFVARGVAGQALLAVDRPLMKRLLARLDQRPVVTVFLLRSCFLMNPTVNYALALSSISYRDYIVGTGAGLLAPFAVLSVLVDHFAG